MYVCYVHVSANALGDRKRVVEPLELELQLELRELGTEHGPSAETVQAFNS